jgi:RNA polymerase sigma-70 factor (ECF subfamily)
LTGDEEAKFTEFVERQSRFVFRVAYAVLLNSFDAEDAVQEVFLKLYRNQGWHPLDNERAFLARVAWRVAVERRPRSNVQVSDESELVEETPSVHPDPEQRILAANQKAVIHSMIATLPEDLRVPLVLSSFEDLNSRQIGEVLDVPEGTVRTRLQRARQMLRQKLGALQTNHREEASHG